MRSAVIADIHSNLEAFQAVLRDLEEQGGADEIWCLGDIVGYGPDPRACIQLVRQLQCRCVAGNHDWAAIGKLDTSAFNLEAAAAAQWTAAALQKLDVDFLAGLPLTLQVDDFTLAHGSPRAPIWEYVLSVQSARANFAAFDTRFCLIGHSHSPLLFELDSRNSCREQRLPEQLSLKTDSRFIINCGSVGQPRDGDPRASYAIIDAGQAILWHRRVVYDFRTTQEKILDADLPARLASRLSVGW
ncbi:MAG: metallophosphoesterase family protein [Dehalococcoidia bacterium]|nr:metallophosphoesterase family protein [Dehalococcoidia bacterium]